MGLLPRDFFFLITRSPPKIVVELLHKAQKYMNIEDAIVEKEMTDKGKRDEGTSRHPEPSLQWPRPIYALVEVKAKHKYCRFHQDHGHCIDECTHLKDQIETLIHQGKLQKFVRKTNLFRRHLRYEKN